MICKYCREYQYGTRPFTEEIMGLNIHICEQIGPELWYFLRDEMKCLCGCTPQRQVLLSEVMGRRERWWEAFASPSIRNLIENPVRCHNCESGWPRNKRNASKR